MKTIQIIQGKQTAKVLFPLQLQQLPAITDILMECSNVCGKSTNLISINVYYYYKFTL